MSAVTAPARRMLFQMTVSLYGQARPVRVEHYSLIIATTITELRPHDAASRISYWHAASNSFDSTALYV